MNKVQRIKELVKELQDASYAYYAKDNPVISDKKYDDLYDELTQLESETGIILAGSPTQKVQGYVIDSLKKVKHSKPMLSANKTKDISEIKKFIGNKRCVASWKLDGLTIGLRYVNGIFTQAITRGSGDLGEDVTHTMKMCKNIPVKLPYCVDLEVRGECVISWKEFERINSTLSEPYKHPRNLAAGSVRQLDSNEIKNSLETKLREIESELKNLDKEKVLSIAKEKLSILKNKMNELVEMAKEAGKPVIENAANAAKKELANVTREVLKTLESK